MAKKAVKRQTKKPSKILKILEGVVLLGTAAAVLIKFFKGKKK